MAVPDYQTLMRPVLAQTGDGREHTAAALRAAVTRELSLTTDDIAERLPSGRDTTLRNRIGWALTYLFRAGLLERPHRSVYRITARGQEVLQRHPDRVDNSVLETFEEFRAFRRRNEGLAAPGLSPAVAAEQDAATPEERAAAAYAELRESLATDLLERVREKPPAFFEDLVLDVLEAMGYGGSRADAAKRLGQSGDEGVDGVIREDKLGLELIYIQAKRWKDSSTVGRPEIQRFVGALHGQRASKGVFITTTGFSREAREYADGVSPRVILVDGPELAQLMIDHDVGVTVATRYEIKRVDSDYFELDEDSA